MVVSVGLQFRDTEWHVGGFGRAAGPACPGGLFRGSGRREGAVLGDWKGGREIVFSCRAQAWMQQVFLQHLLCTRRL